MIHIKVILFGLLLVLSVYADKKDDKKDNNYGTVIGIDLGTTYSW
jgi:hypothetical protein